MLIAPNSLNVVKLNLSETPEQPKIENVEDQLDILIGKLATCESGQIPDMKVLDSNNKFSYGWLQFQKATFDGFGEQYGLPHDDILSPAQQIPIAKKMIENGLWFHWKICGEKVGLNHYKGNALAKN